MGYAVTICRKVLFTTKPRPRAPHFPNYAYKDADLTYFSDCHYSETSARRTGNRMMIICNFQKMMMFFNLQMCIRRWFICMMNTIDVNYALDQLQEDATCNCRRVNFFLYIFLKLLNLIILL